MEPDHTTGKYHFPISSMPSETAVPPAAILVELATWLSQFAKLNFFRTHTVWREVEFLHIAV
jgi:hypothetical protein